MENDNKNKVINKLENKQKLFNRTTHLSNEFLINWRVDMIGKHTHYIRDDIVSCLLVNYSKKGAHSFGYDYATNKVHRSKVFGYFPSMTVEEARLKATKIKKECIEKNKSYDELFEIHRLPSYLYFLMTEKGEIKIGHSTDLWNRLNSLVITQRGIYLLGIRPESKLINENKLHYLYRAFRIKGGEYFKKNKFLLELITHFCVYRESDKQILRLMDQQDKQIYKENNKI